MLTQLIYIELLKAKRSLALLMMVVCPSMVVLLNVLLLLQNPENLHKQQGWHFFWLQNFAMWAYFMLPLYVALITALLNGIEHKNNGWRFMLTLPISKTPLFLAKFAVAWFFCVGASATFFVVIFLVLTLLQTLGFDGGTVISKGIITNLLQSLVAVMGILAIQHTIAWRWKNIVVPLGVGVVATMSIIQFGSSEYWDFYPWTYPLVAMNGGEPSNQYLAICYSVIIAVVAAFFAKYWLARREVNC